MMQVPHNRLTFDGREAEDIVRTVMSGWWAAGPRVAQLETALAQRAGVARAVCVGSGLAALRLALLAIGVQHGDKVLVPAYSCVALANAVMARGAYPVPVDVSAPCWNINPSQVRDAISQFKPKAIIAVNTFGVPAQIDEMRYSAVPIIEDCAHAFGIDVGGTPLGSRGGVGVLSFYATKLIAAGEGGAVLTNSANVADFVMGSRDYTNQPPAAARLNDKMNDLEATLALCQLNRLDEMMAGRLRLARRYHQLLGTEATRTGAFRLPDMTPPRVWYRYAVEMTTCPARQVIQTLKKRGVHAEQPVVNWRLAGHPPCPVADCAYDHVLSLPIYPTLTCEEQDYVASCFIEACRELATAQNVS